MLRGNGGKLKESSQSFQLSSYSVTFLERNIWSRALALVKFTSLKLITGVTKAEMKNETCKLLVNSSFAPRKPLLHKGL